MEQLATNLRRRAEQLGISNAEVARRASLSDRRYGNYVNGSREPDLSTLVRISKVLGTSLDELVGANLPVRFDTRGEASQERIGAALQALHDEDLARLAIMIEALASARSIQSAKK